MTIFTPEQVKLLSAKLSPGHVKERTQAGRKLSYIEGWHAIAEANAIFGFDGWQRETCDIRMVAEKPRKIGQSGKDGWSVSYVAKVRVNVGGIIREGVGAGHGIDADLGLAHESAIKEAETDAMKRALMTFGNPFGLALYDKKQENVGDEADDARADEIGAYAAQLRTTLANATHPDDIRSLWGADQKYRDEIGLTVGHPLHKALHSEWLARGKLLASQQINKEAAE